MILFLYLLKLNKRNDFNMDKRQIDIYNDLIKQYEKLSIEEQRAILIYKSKLFRFMNAITSILYFEDLSEQEILNQIENLDSYLKEINDLRKVLERSENMTIKFSVFHNIHLDNYILLVKDLKEVYHVLLQAREKFILQDDLTVYRGITLNEKENLNSLSRGNIISTSIKLDDVDPFLFHEHSNFLYVIHLKKGTKLLVSPISLVLTYHDESDYLYHKLNGLSPTLLKLMNRGDDGCQEVILFQDSLNIIETTKQDKSDDMYSLFVITLDTEPVYSKNLTK